MGGKRHDLETRNRFVTFRNAQVNPARLVLGIGGDGHDRHKC
jgi:hypothetical protein